MRNLKHATPLRRSGRQGFALVDVIIGGVILAIGLGGIAALTSRALAMQNRSEDAVVAAALLDEKLSLVLTEGPDYYAGAYNLTGRFDPPYDNFTYEMQFRDNGVGQPVSVTAIVRADGGRTDYRVETLIAERRGEEPYPDREPEEPLDRQARYDEELE